MTPTRFTRHAHPILGINGIRLIGQKSGVARTIEAFIESIDQLEHSFSEIHVYSPIPIENTSSWPVAVKNIVLPSRLPPSLWEQIILPLKHGKRHVLYCPSYTIPLFARCPVLLVHHGSYEGYRDAHLSFHWWPRLKARIMYPLSAHRANMVSTVSKHSKNDMAKYYHLDPSRISVIPNGVDTTVFKPMPESAAVRRWKELHIGTDVPFILYVGKPTIRRNLPGLLSAFANLKRNQHIKHKLLLIGTSLPGSSFGELIDELAIANDVISIDHANHETIALAYNACDVMVYPSSYEGFGMPVLEAMACGTPVIALDNTAIPEFSSGIAKLLPNAKCETLERGIMDVLSDEELRQSMSIKGPLRAAEYEWSIINQKYMNLLSHLSDGNLAASTLLSRNR